MRSERRIRSDLPPPRAGEGRGGGLARRWRLLALASVLACITGLAACTCEPTHPADAGVDGGFDAGLDAGGLDAGPPDAGPLPDAGDPEWIQLTEVPPDCDIRVARNPDSVLPLPRFEPCGDGCRQLAADWRPDANGARLFPQSGQSFYADGHTTFVYARPAPAPSGYEARDTLVARDDGHHLLVLRVTNPLGELTCTATDLAIAPQTFAFTVNVFMDDVFEVSPVRAHWDDPIEGWAIPSNPRPVIPDTKHEAWTSDTTTLFEGGLSGIPTYHRMDATGRIELVGGGELLDRPAIFDDTLFFSRLGAVDYSVVMVLPGETSSTELIAPPGAGANGPATDGHDVAWVQLYDPGPTGYGRTELWTSPYTTDPSSFEPRQLAVFPSAFATNPIGVGFGRVWAPEYIVSPETTYIRIYSLSGDTTRQWILPPMRKLLRPAIVTPDEIGFYISYVSVRQGLEAIRFYRYDSLELAP